jgi:uncharacterized membrane protein YedE/YeeE
MKNSIVAFICGLLFAAGLGISGMTKPERVQGFLDIFGNWDPSLVFTMGGAVIMYALLYQLSRTLTKPMFAETFSVPTRRDLDIRLLSGSAMFGFGWGLSGYCPAPALVAAGGGVAPVFVFVGSMLAGMWLFSVVDKLILARR